MTQGTITNAKDASYYPRSDRQNLVPYSHAFNQPHLRFVLYVVSAYANFTHFDPDVLEMG